MGTRGARATVTAVLVALLAGPVLAPPASAEPGGLTVEDDTFTALASTPTALDVLANDTGDDLEIVAVSYSSSSFAWPDDDGRLEYKTEREFYEGTDTFTYTVRDATGETATATVTVQVEERPPPVDDVASTAWNTPVVVPVLGNDPEGSRLLGIDDPPDGVDMFAWPDEFVFEPRRDFAGTFTIRYHLFGSRTQASVTVTVDPPAYELEDDTVQAAWGSEVVVLRPLANDLGEDLWFQDLPEAQHGQLSFATEAPFDRLLYRPDPGFAGTDSFTYTTVDAVGRPATATIRVEVVRVGPARDPVARAVGNPDARDALRAPDYDGRRPVSRVLSTQVGSRATWTPSVSPEVTSYDVRVAGETVCEVAGNSCLVEGIVLRPGDDVSVVAHRPDGFSSEAARVEVAAPGTRHLVGVVYLPSGEPRLNAAARRVLRSLAARASADGYGLSVRGHADDTGSRRAAEARSRRATSVVADALRGHGLGPSSVSWSGDARPVVPNDSARHRAANRRVEVYAS